MRIPWTKHKNSKDALRKKVTKEQKKQGLDNLILT